MIVPALAAICILNLLPCAATVQGSALGNGSIVERMACETFPVTTYERYVETGKSGYAAEVAAAVGGAPADLNRLGRERPEMIEEVYKQRIADFDKRAEEAMRERSAAYWPEKLNAPLLIMHGGVDWRVRVGDVLVLAQRLQELSKKYELIVYADDDHGVSLNSADADRRTIAWFKRHLR